MLLKDLLRERAELAQARTVRAEGAGRKKSAGKSAGAKSRPKARAPKHRAASSTGNVPSTETAATPPASHPPRASGGEAPAPGLDAAGALKGVPSREPGAPAQGATGPAQRATVKAPELRDTAEIARRVRSDIQEAVRANALPPADYSVRTSKYSMGSEINVVAKLPFPVLNPDAFRLEGGHVSFNRDSFRTRYTARAETVLATLEAIVKAYHWDRSDLSSDYHHSRFSYDVQLYEGDEVKAIEADKRRGSDASPPANASTPAHPQQTASPAAPASGLQLEVQDGSPVEPRGRRGRSGRVQQAFDLDSPLFRGAQAPANRQHLASSSSAPVAASSASPEGEVSTPAPTSAAASPPGFEEALERYIARSQDELRGRHARLVPNQKPPSLSVEVGPRFVRVVRTTGNSGDRSVDSFVDRRTGDVRKAASWKAPAPRVTGSVFDPVWSAPASTTKGDAPREVPATSPASPATTEADPCTPARGRLGPSAYEQKRVREDRPLAC